MRARPGFVPVGPVRAHVVQLRAAGMPLERIAAAARVPAPVLESILEDRPLARRQVGEETAQRLRAVTPARFLAGDSRLVDATGARRRLQALTALGWSRTALAARSGLHPETVRTILTAPRCQAHAAAAIRTLYDRVWDEAPPAATPVQRQAVDLARAEAATHRWAPPMAWDDDELDDPTARPHGTVKARVTARERLDEVMHLARAGVPLEDAARRAGYSCWGYAQSCASRRSHPTAGLAERLELERAA